MKMKTSDIAKALSICVLAVLTVVFPKETADSTVNSINVCINSIIPSMFAFMVITTYIQDSGAYRFLFRPVMPLLKRIIRADERLLSIFLLSLIGGYPVGIKLLKEETAHNKYYSAIINKCETASMFCYCISPSFALIMIGSGIFGDPAAGAIIYVSNILACLTMAGILSRVYDLKSLTASGTERKGSLTDAVNSASRALFTVCTVIVAFNIALACISALLRSFGIEMSPLLTGIFEISNLLKTDSPSVSLIPIVSGIASTGGLCVMLQCSAIAGSCFSLKRFFAARIPCAILSSLYSLLFLQFTDISVSASTINSQYIYDFSANKIIVLILTAMCIIIFYRSDKFFRKV